MPRRLALAAALSLAALTAPAGAHSTFLLPSSTVLSKPQWITVDGAAGNDMFFFNHAPLRLDNLRVSAPDGSSVTPENVMTGKLRSVFDLQLTQTGTYRIASAFAGVTARYKDRATGQSRGWRGSAASFEQNVPADAVDLNVNEAANRLETFVTVGKPSEIRPSGAGLEFVPVTHPNDLFSGEQATFGFVLDGQPAAGLDVEVIPGGNRYRNQVGAFTVKTDARGQVLITWPGPGIYRIEVSTRDQKTTLKQARERRLGYAAILEVLPQ